MRVTVPSFSPDEISPWKTRNSEERKWLSRQASASGKLSQPNFSDSQKDEAISKKTNSQINGDLLLRDLTLIKANLAVSLSLQVDVIAVGLEENTNYWGKGHQSIMSS